MRVEGGSGKKKAVRLTLQGPEDITECFADENPFKYGLKDTFFFLRQITSGEKMLE